MNPDLMLVVANVLVCAWRCGMNLRRGSLLWIAWALLTYFALCCVPLAGTQELSWYRGFTAEFVTAKHDSIEKALRFALAFSAVMALVDVVLSRIWRREAGPADAYPVSEHGMRWVGLRWLLLGFWLVGGAIYLWQMRASGYRDYVEGASWALVFFWAATPLIVLHAMQRQWGWALLLCLPYLYLAVHLTVRSFALLSLVPLLVVALQQAMRTSGRRISYARFLRNGAAVVAVLLVVSFVFNQYKKSDIVLPDSGMPFGFAQVVAMADREGQQVGVAGLQLYGWNYIHPFMRLVGLQRPDIVDTPAVIARLLEGVPDDWPVYFHYPALVWSDAYLAFGWWGLWLAALWAGVLRLWDWAMARNALLSSLLLPFFCWHCYMLVRGAIAVASAPMAYAFYLVLIAYLLAFGARVVERGVPANVGRSATEPATQSRLANLMA